MKTITYNSSSKVIKRIVELLNRKTPLPLDGNGDPNWGTSGQVLATDGSGSTLWVNQGGGGGGGGHTIEDADGTDLTQRANLQFLDAHLADDSVNDRTQVEVVKEVTENAFDALDETDIDNDGFYAFEISGGTVIDASQVAYDGGTVADALTQESVSVTADGVKTYSALLDELYALIDLQKITNRCVFTLVTSVQTNVHQITVITPNTNLQFYRTSLRSSVNVQTSVVVKQTGSTYGYYNGATYTDESGLIPASGRVLAVYY